MSADTDAADVTEIEPAMETKAHKARWIEAGCLEDDAS